MNISDATTRLSVSTSTEFRDVFVIGASAGALVALTDIVAGLPADFPGAVFIVTHMAPQRESLLPELLGRVASLPVTAPVDHAPIRAGTIHLCSPDRHMLLEPTAIRIVRGPRENRHRPAIDPLFRSAAWSFGPRVVGIVLTGYLDDGAAGLWAIKSCGGATVVQDPADAEHPEMPTNALRLNDVDYCLPLAAIAPLMVRLAVERVPATPFRKLERLNIEKEFTILDEEMDMRDMSRLGNLSPFTCPTCRGALWELQDGDIMRYRCHTGHAFSAESLLRDQTEEIEESLYSALRAVEEKASALRRLGSHYRERFPTLHASYIEQADELDRSSHTLRLLLSGTR